MDVRRVRLQGGNEKVYWVDLDTAIGGAVDVYEDRTFKVKAFKERCMIDQLILFDYYEGIHVNEEVAKDLRVILAVEKSLYNVLALEQTGKPYLDDNIILEDLQWNLEDLCSLMEKYRYGWYIENESIIEQIESLYLFKKHILSLNRKDYDRKGSGEEEKTGDSKVKKAGPGRPSKSVPKHFKFVYDQQISGKITINKACSWLNISRNTYLKWVAEYQRNHTTTAGKLEKLA